MLAAIAAAGGLVLAAGGAWWARRGSWRRPEDTRRMRAGSVWLVVPVATVTAGAIGASAPAVWVPAGVLYAVGGVVAGWIDLDVHRLPNKVLAVTGAGAGIAAVLAAAVGGRWDALAWSAGGAVGLGLVYVVMVVLGSTGLGDVKLAFVSGMVLGLQGWQVVVRGAAAGILVAGLVAAGLLITRRATRSDHLAFGPAIVAGAVVALCVG